MQLFTTALVLILAASAGFAQNDREQLIINGKVLDAEEMKVIHRLEQQFGATAAPGRYWYDARTGLYGAEGFGAFGQIVANLPVGGKLQPDASKGDTGVWVNGRQLHRSDVSYLQQCTPVIPGRYWLDAYGNSGVEGGPAQWNLAMMCAAARQRAGGSLQGQFGSVLGDGETSGAIFRTPSGGTSMVTCGPDGGCLY